MSTPMKLLAHRALLLVGAAAALALVGCGPDITPPPSTSAVSHDLSYSWGSLTLVDAGASGFQIRNSAVIGRDGGIVRLGLHELIVPKNAVRNPTLFNLSTKLGSNLIVDLTALDQVTGEVVDRFPIDLQLRLSYLMIPVPRGQLHKLVVVWLKDDSPSGELRREKTTHLPREKYVVGWINHFSQFAMGME